MIKTITIIVPTYNEEKFIKQTLQRVVSSDTLGLKKEIIIIDDAAKGKTYEIVKKFISGKKYRGVSFKHIKNQVNIGKGGSVRKGFRAATGDLVMIQDADLEYDPSDYPLLIKPFFENDADVVYGSRFVTNRSHRVLYYWHFLANRALTMLSNFLTNLNFTDMETGYKLFKKSVLDKIIDDLRADGFGIEAELTAKFAKLKILKIYEVGISYTGRSFEEGKVIGWKDGVKNIWEILKYNLLPKSPIWLTNLFTNLRYFVKEVKKEVTEELINFPSTSGRIIFLISIIAIGILLRTAGLSWGINTDGIKHGSPYHDEGHTYNIVFDPKFNEHFGEYEISKPVNFYRIIGSNIISAGRSVSIIPESRQLGPFFIFFLLRSITSVFGIASIYVIYLISRKLFDEKWSLFTTLLYSLLPGQWFMSQVIKGEAIVTFFMPFAIYSLFMVFERGTLFWYLVSAIVVGVGMATKATFLVTLPALVILAMAIFWKNKKNIKKVILYSLTAVVVAFGLFAKFYPYPFCCMAKYKEALSDPRNAFQRTSLERYSVSPDDIYKIWTQYESKEFPFMTMAFAEPATYLHVLGLLISFTFIIVLIRRKDSRYLLIISIVTTYVFFFLSLNQYSEVNEDRYIVPFAPFVALLTGLVFYSLDSVKIKNIRISSFVHGILLTTAIVVTVYTFVFSMAYYVPFIKDPRTQLARWINSQTGPTETVFIYLPSSRDKIYSLKSSDLVYTYEEKDLIESGKVVPDYIVLYKTINHKGRWGSLNFVGDIVQKPYGDMIPRLLERRYQKLITFGKRPMVFGSEKPETYITPTYDVYQKIK